MSRQKREQIAFIGPEASGKTALLKAYKQEAFPESHNATMGVNYLSKKQDVEGEEVTLQCWDCPGAERFRLLISSYIRNSGLIALTVDLSKSSGLEEVQPFRTLLVETYAGKPKAQRPTVWLVGTKTDLDCANGPSDGVIAAFRRDLSAAGFTTEFSKISAKSGDGIQDLFEDMVLELRRTRPQRIADDQPQPQPQPQSEKPEHAYSHKGGFFQRHPAMAAVGVATMGAAILFGLVAASLASAPVAIGIGCAIAALALLTLVVMQRHQTRSRYLEI